MQGSAVTRLQSVNLCDLGAAALRAREAVRAPARQGRPFVQIGVPFAMRAGFFQVRDGAKPSAEKGPSFSRRRDRVMFAYISAEQGSGTDGLALMLGAGLNEVPSPADCGILSRSFLDAEATGGRDALPNFDHVGRGGDHAHGGGVRSLGS
jgi:hypothetical protein